MTVSASSPIERRILHWQNSPLPATTAWLLEQHAAAGDLDLSGSVLVVPTVRAGHRLLELLLEAADQGNRVFTPPEILTIGQLPEVLYRPSRPLASPLVESLAWVRALQETPTEQLREFTRLIPPSDDTAGWRGLANLLATWHRELASHNLMFEDVLDTGDRLDIFQEHARWEALGEVQRRYLDILNRQEVWDRQSARLVALKNQECRTDRKLYLIGLVDLAPVFREMLAQVASQVTALVFADPDRPERFDELGCLQPAAWQDVVVDICDEQILVADQPADQARLVVDALAELQGQFATDDITVTVPDTGLISHIGRGLAAEGIRTRDEAGSTIGNTRPYVLLELLAGWLESESFEAFAELVRHPDLYQWLVSRTGDQEWLGQLDHYQNNRLPVHVSSDPSGMNFAGLDRRGQPRYDRLAAAWRELVELVQTVRSRPGEPDQSGQPLDRWALPWRQILVVIYRDTVLDTGRPEDRRTIRASQAIVRSLIEIEQVGDLTPDNVPGVDAIYWALERCRQETVADPFEAEAISLAGWLDSPWDDTPVALLTCVNEGLIPSSENSSLFLPNTIRSSLGLLDNQRRFARDAWAISLILHSRQHVRFITGRRDDDGQPLLPSRLLLTGTVEQIARRSQRLFSNNLSIPAPVTGDQQRPRRQQLVIPRPHPSAEPHSRMRVTDFRSYLMCPYRFYLTRILGLERLTDDLDELNAAQFGSLLHDVLEQFGRSACRDSEDPEEIAASLENGLQELARERYGPEPMAAVAVQLEQATLRLRAFARWQAEHRQAGFRIFEVEREKTCHTFDLDGQPFVVSGQIDRIDINDRTGTIGVYDYKTGDQAKPPREYHQDRQGNWIDLQLPLYRHLLSQFGLPADYRVETGLILLAGDTERIRLETADWSESDLEAADLEAFAVMRKVRRGEFWPPVDKGIPVYLDDLDGLCQTRVFQRWAPESSSGEDVR